MKAKTKKGGAMFLLTDKAKTDSGRARCQHCQIWTHKVGQTLSFDWLIPKPDGEWHKTRVVMSLCVPCSNLYNALPALGKSTFVSECRRNVFASLRGKELTKI